MDFEFADSFTGMPYSKDFDCADFAVHVAREAFGRNVTLPAERPRGPRAHRKLAEASRPYGERTDTPEDGDIVLMYDVDDNAGSPGHVGIYAQIGPHKYVMHNAAKLGGSVLTRVDRLFNMGLTIEGFYKWLS